MTSTKYKRLPLAGDLEQDSGSEVFYLAPRPVPTGMKAFSSRNLQRGSDGTYIDFAITTANLEFSVRGWIGSVSFIIFFFFLSGFGLGVWEHVEYGAPMLEILITLVLPNWYMWGFISLILSFNCYLCFCAIHQLTKHPPIRFNRQRREVAYVAKRGQPPRFVPWEEVIACVTSGKVVTQYGVHNSFSLMIGLRDTESGDVLWITVPTGSLMLAVSEWEAIRSYMEEGLGAIPQPVSEEFEPGTVAFFHYCRQVYRDNHSYMRYLFGFMLIQFCSGWTLPCHIAAWVESLPKTSFPKTVLEWSKPLPPEQWQKPSDALIEESKAVRKSLKAGRSVFDHFRDQAKAKADGQSV